MNKKLITFIVLSSFVFGGIGGWVLVRYVLPHLNQNSFFVRWNLLPQTAPIVITNQQVIHEDEGTDSIAAIQHAQPWVVSIVSGTSQANTQVLAAGITLTSDGLVATTKAALGKAGSTSALSVVFADGKVSAVTVAAEDSASDLVFVKASVSGEPTASFGSPSQLDLGERVILLTPSVVQQQATDGLTYVSSTTANVNPLATYSTDTIATTFGVDGATGLSGSAVLGLDGNVDGIFDSTGVITADTVKSAMNTYFAGGKIRRMQLGLRYEYTPASLGTLYDVQSGATVVSVAPGSAAAQAGIQAGDVIAKVGGTSVSPTSSLESLLENYTSGQEVPMAIVRGKFTVNLDVNMLVK